MLAILLAMLLIDPLQYLMSGQYEDLSQTLQHDPGTLGLRVLMVMLCLNTLMQVGIQMFAGPADAALCWQSPRFMVCFSSSTKWCTSRAAKHWACTPCWM